MEWLFELLAGLVIFVTFWSMIPRYEWWFRVADFPRNQLIVLGFVVLIAWIVWYQPTSTSEWLWVVLLIVALGFQLRMVLPYTFVWKKQVKTAVNKPDAHRVTLLVSNVLTPNPNKQALIDLVNKHQPDILLTLETDKAWEDALSVIEPDYPYNVKVPLDNLYGMHLYSKLELINPEVKYLVVDDIPSIHTQVRLKMGKVIWFYALHPMPPSPTEADKSVTRDAELLMLGRHINPQDLPVIVAGDLNDVAWSHTTRMFQRISGLLDPRIGRHFINTFHAGYPFLRWALDHVFHSNYFTFVDMHRLDKIGSDHFPVLTTLQYEPEAKVEQPEPEPTLEEHKESVQTIQDGLVEGEKVSETIEEVPPANPEINATQTSTQSTDKPKNSL